MATTGSGGASGLNRNSIMDSALSFTQPIQISEGVADKETLAFSERTKKWSSFYSYQPDMMVDSNVGMLSFKDGSLWEHNQGTTFNNFYGVQYDSELEFICNDQPFIPKAFNTVSLESSDPFDFEITAGTQATDVYTVNFDNKEGIFYAQIPNDKNSLGGIIEGDKMRAPSLLMKLSSSLSTMWKLFSVNVGFTPSNPNIS